MNLSQEFDEMNNGYTDKMERFLPYYQKMIVAIPEYLPTDFEVQNVLDLGSGSGNVTMLMKKKFASAAYLLVDASTEMLNECAERFKDSSNVRCQQAWFQDLDFEANSFDVVTAGFSLHHLEAVEKQAIFSKIHEWLRPGGYLSISDLWVDKNDNPYHSKILHHWELVAKQQGTQQEEWNWLMDHYEKYDRPDGYENQINWLKNAGFENVNCNWRETAWVNVWARK